MKTTNVRNSAIHAYQERKVSEAKEREAILNAELESVARNNEHALTRGLRLLSSWFPGVEWLVIDQRAGQIGTAAGYGDGYQVVVSPLGEANLELHINGDPRHESDPIIHLVERRTDSSSGYLYWAKLSPRIKYPSDLGAALLGAELN